jgi:hypothetical protein
LLGSLPAEVAMAASITAELPFAFVNRTGGDPMSALELWELFSYVVTVIGLPLAILTYWTEQRNERENEEEEIYQLLSVAYTDFLKLVMANPDLQLRSKSVTPELTDEQQERRLVVFEILISLFERAYLLTFDEEMTDKQKRLWHSWDDYMREWCRRGDFYAMLPHLLEGEDPDFVACIQRIAAEEHQAALNGLQPEVKRSK